MNAQDRIKQATIAIMRHPTWCAFSGVIACGDNKVKDGVPTAVTDGYNKYYGEAFVNKLADAELRFVVLHEALHVAYRHLNVWKALWDQDKRRTNIAADHFVNLALVDTDKGEGFIKMPKVGVQPRPEYRGMSVRQIYNLLATGPDDDADNPDGEGGFDQHDFEKAGQPAAADQQAQADEISRALRQGEQVARMRGKGKGGRDALMSDLLQPRQDWKQLLREFVQEQCSGRDESTWSRPNRRFIGEDIYMPSMYSESLGPIVVGFDTSGSCFSGTVINRFASELAAIIAEMRPESVLVVYWDYGVQHTQKFEHGAFNVTDLKFKGGGGTDGSSLFRYLKEQSVVPSAIVNFTDGYVGSWGTSDVPTLWAITERNITAPWGRSIHIEV